MQRTEHPRIGGDRVIGQERVLTWVFADGRAPAGWPGRSRAGRRRSGLVDAAVGRCGGRPVGAADRPVQPVAADTAASLGPISQINMLGNTARRRATIIARIGRGKARRGEQKQRDRDAD